MESLSNDMSDKVTSEQINKVFNSLETVLRELENEHGTNTSFLPLTVRKFMGGGGVPAYIGSAQQTIKDIRGLMDIGGSERFNPDTMTITSMKELINVLTSLENSLDHEGQSEAVKSHRVVIQEMVSRAEQMETQSQHPAERAMNEMQQSIENDPDLKTDFDSSNESS